MVHAEAVGNTKQVTKGSPGSSKMWQIVTQGDTHIGQKSDGVIPCGHACIYIYVYGQRVLTPYTL